MSFAFGLITFGVVVILFLAGFGFDFGEKFIQVSLKKNWILIVAAISITASFIKASIDGVQKDEKIDALNEDLRQATEANIKLDSKDENIRNEAFKRANDSGSQEETAEPFAHLIGMGSVKEEILELRNYIKVQKKRAGMSLKSPKLNLHIVFTGAPGTGKTTIAREIGKMYKDLGLLTKGHVVEVSRAEIVAEYVGQTAPKTKKVVESALGGVLFIDEAYTLAEDDSSFGKEAIDTLLKEMEDKRDQLAVIVAGYTAEMNKFIATNPGLQSRFTRFIHFPDYNKEELFQVFQLLCKQNEYSMSKDAAQQLALHLNDVAPLAGEIGNARYIRNLFERVTQKQANRLSKHENPELEHLKDISVQDICFAAEGMRGLAT